MANQARQKILIRRGSGTKAAIIWPLVLYTIIQVASNLLTDQQNNSLHLPDHNHRHVDDSSYNLDNHQISSDAAQVLKLDERSLRLMQQDTSSQKLCSSASKISLTKSRQHQQGPLLTSPAEQQAANYLSSLLQLFNPLQQANKINHGDRTIFGGKILMAEASSVYEANQDKEIIILNASNFNTELIQHKHTFPHIKLIEYYVSFCGFCAKFKTTYTKLAKAIQPWRNVIRSSAIDLGLSTNSPIAHSWSVEVVPTLRIHPPPNPQLAEKLDKQLSTWSSTLSPGELQKSMFEEYNSSNLMIHSLSVAQYMDKVSLLKQDLLSYVERYVRANPTQLPASWPNLRPVAETTLSELRKNHPRQELFLVIEGLTSTSATDQSSPTSSLGLNVVLELSSSAPWRAIRYVRASENRDLVEDVIAQQKRASELAASGNQVVGQVELLNNLLHADQQNGGNNIVLVHIDDSHSPIRTSGPSTAFPLMTIVTGADLVTMEQSVLIEHRGSLNSRAKRAINHIRYSRSASSGSDAVLDRMSNGRKVELLVLYVKQTYTETNEDRDFVAAINSYDETSRSNEATDRTSLEKTPGVVGRGDKAAVDAEHGSKKFAFNIGNYNPFSSAENGPKITFSSYSYPSDYEDKLKAIRYALFNEVPRKSLIDKSLVEQQEKLNTLVNLIAVIKSYFPLPDSASIQFIDGVHSYLKKQQSRLASANNRDQAGPAGFDTRAFKQELKRLEATGKRLPEIKEWKQCKVSGYSCALWRLFHTLTAFEYKKLSQIRQPPSHMSALPSALISSSAPSTGSQIPTSDMNLSPTAGAITMSNLTGLRSPVERLVSPPSTTTSLSLTIATPISSHTSDGNGGNGVSANIISSEDATNNNNNKPLTEAELPAPVLLVMRDYITTFFSCEECGTRFRTETAELSFERIRHQEPAEFSILWLWETHNRVNKRLSVDPETNPHDHPKVWFPTYEQCPECYKKPPSFLQDTTADATAIFHESIEWNRPEVLRFLLSEYTKQPMDSNANLFGYHVPYGLWFIIVLCICCLAIIVVLRCATDYVERQRRHKATLLNGNGGQYTMELQ